MASSPLVDLAHFVLAIVLLPLDDFGVDLVVATILSVGPCPTWCAPLVYILHKFCSGMIGVQAQNPKWQSVNRVAQAGCEGREVA